MEKGKYLLKTKEGITRAYHKLLVKLSYIPFIREYRINKRKIKRIEKYKGQASASEIEAAMSLGQRNSFRKRTEDLTTRIASLEKSNVELRQQYEEAQNAKIETEKINQGLADTLKAYIVRAVILQKEAEGLRTYIKVKDARVRELENEFQGILTSLFELPQFKKIPMVIVRKSGGVIYQSPASKERDGSLEGRNLEKVIVNCSEPLMIEKVIVNDKRYDCWVFPLIGKRSADYSAIYLNPVSLLQGVKDRLTGVDKEFQQALNEIRVGLAKLGKQLGMDNEQENQLQADYPSQA